MAMADVATQVRAAYARVERAWRASKWRPSAEQLWAIRRYKEDGHGDINGLLRRVFPSVRRTTTTQLPPQMPLYSLLRWQRGPTAGEDGEETEYEDAEALFCETAPKRIRDLRAMALQAERNIVLATRSLLSAFDGAPRLPRGTVLFRGVKSVDGLLTGKKKEFAASGLWSSSVDPRVSRSFAAPIGDDGDKNKNKNKSKGKKTLLLLIVLRVADDADVPFILVTDAARGKHADADADAFGEREVLLPHGLKVRVLRTSRMPDIDTSRGDDMAMTTVFAEAIGRTDAPSLPLISPTHDEPPEVTIPAWTMRMMDGCAATAATTPPSEKKK